MEYLFRRARQPSKRPEAVPPQPLGLIFCAKPRFVLPAWVLASLGDLAARLDPDSALGHISAAPANN